MRLTFVPWLTSFHSQCLGLFYWARSVVGCVLLIRVLKRRESALKGSRKLPALRRQSMAGE